MDNKTRIEKLKNEEYQDWSTKNYLWSNVWSCTKSV